MSKSNGERIEGFGPVISTYTSETAIEDGFLVRVVDAAPGLRGMPTSFLVTAAVWAAVEAEVAKGERTAENILGPLMADASAITVARRKNTYGDDETLWTKGLEGNFTGRALWIGRNELNGITVMFPEDN